jgi:hypothetical protein
MVFVQPVGEKNVKQIGKTAVQKDTFNPLWSEKMPAVNVGDVVTVEIWDKDVAQDDIIGRHTFTVTDDYIKQHTVRLSFDQVEQLQLILPSPDDTVAKRPRLVAQLGHSDRNWPETSAESRSRRSPFPRAVSLSRLVG